MPSQVAQVDVPRALPSNGCTMRRIAKVSLPFVALVLLTACAGSDELSTANKRGEYATAPRDLTPPVEQGDTRAQHSPGAMDDNPGGVPQVDAQTVRRYRRAAGQGNARAQYGLGLMYAKGLGVRKDDAEAALWFRKAAEQDHASAQFNLAVMYEQGRGVRQDDSQAVRWYRRAAEQGYARAQSNLGVLYSKGRGVPRDDAQAADWFRKAAEQGNGNAQFNLAGMYAKGKGVPKNVAQAALWARKAAEQGNALAQFNLGIMYANGRGVPRDDTQAALWLRKAAEQGHAGAQYNLGIFYDDGRGVPKDDAQSVRWYRKAAEQGHANAQGNLGFMFHEGRGVAQDDAQAVLWYRKAAEQGQAGAQVKLGRMYADGKGIQENNIEAYKWIDLASKATLPAAIYTSMFELGNILQSRMSSTEIAEARRLAREWRAGRGLRSAETSCKDLQLRSGLPVQHQPFFGCIEKTAKMRAADAAFLRRVKKLGYDRKAGAKKSIALGWKYFRQGRFDAAMKRFNQAWLQNPDNPNILHGFALVLIQRDKNVAGAEILFKRAISNPKVWSGAWSDYARFLLNSRRTDDALKILKRALTRDPGTPDVFMLLANGEFERGDKGKACEYAGEALHRGEQRGRSLVNRFCARE